MDTRTVENPASASWRCRVCRIHVNPETHVPDGDDCHALIEERTWKNHEIE